MPAKLSCLNLHPTVRNLAVTQWLPFMLQGKAEPNPLFGQQVLADDLMWAHFEGFTIQRDASDPDAGPFNCKVKLLQLKADYRGYQKILRRSGSPAIVGSCYKCHVEGMTKDDTGLDKPLYAGKPLHFSVRLLPCKLLSSRHTCLGPDLVYANKHCSVSVSIRGRMYFMLPPVTRVHKAVTRGGLTGRVA